jgi:hypothetical protein
MFNAILKYGAWIVDALRTYKQPVFVYIPPGGELRGGAWVVVDPAINPGMGISHWITETPFQCWPDDVHFFFLEFLSNQYSILTNQT